MFETVLFPIDQSRESMVTASKALEIAHNHKSRLIVLSVVQAEHPKSEETQAVSSLLEGAREKIEQEGVSCDVVERKGNPAFVICDVADEMNADLIVMGTRGLDLGADKESTASRVIELAPCPVLVVP